MLKQQDKKIESFLSIFTFNFSKFVVDSYIFVFLLQFWYTSVQKKCTPVLKYSKKVLNNKNNLLVKVKFMKK